MGKLINKCQYGSIKEKTVMDGVMALHEILHDTKVKKGDGLILKQDCGYPSIHLWGVYKALLFQSVLDVDEVEPPTWQTSLHGGFGSSLLGHLENKEYCLFEGKRIKSPIEIVCMICSFLIYWTGLQKQEVASQVEHGAAILKTTALHFHQHGEKKDGDNNLAIIKTGNMQ